MSLVTVDHQDMQHAIHRALESRLVHFGYYLTKRELDDVVIAIQQSIMDLDGKPRSVEAEAGPTWRPGDGVSNA